MNKFEFNRDFFIYFRNSGAVLNFASGNSYEVDFLGLVSFFKYINKKEKDSVIPFEESINFSKANFNKIKNIFIEESKDTFDFVKSYINLPGMNSFLSHYHGSCCQQSFLDYSEDGVEKDSETMDIAYKNEILPSSTLSFFNESNILYSNNIDSVCNKFTSAYKKISETSKKEFLSLSDILTILKYTVGTRENYVDNYGRKRRRKYIPSGGNNHPTNVYVIKKVSEDIAECYYYKHVNDSLIKIAGNLHFNSVVCSAHTMINRISFKPQICLLYTQTPKRTIYRYKDQRTYRVMNMDLGHVLSAVKGITSTMNLYCSHSYEPDNSSLDFLKSTHCPIIEPLMATSIIGVK